MRSIQRAAPLVKAMLGLPYQNVNQDDYAYFLYEDTISFVNGPREKGKYLALLAGNARRYNTEEMLRMDFMREELARAENL